MPRNCHGLSIKGSGYVKPDNVSADSSRMAEEMKKLLDARAQQDAKFFPQAPVQEPKKK